MSRRRAPKKMKRILSLVQRTQPRCPVDHNGPASRAALKAPPMMDDGRLNRNDLILPPNEEAVESTRRDTIGDPRLQPLMLAWALTPNVHLQPGLQYLATR